MPEISCENCPYLDKINETAKELIDIKIDVGIAKGEIAGVKEDMKDIKDSIKTITADMKGSKNFQIATMTSILVSIGLMILALFVK